LFAIYHGLDSNWDAEIKAVITGPCSHPAAFRECPDASISEDTKAADRSVNAELDTM